MEKFLLIEADTNDADYVSNFMAITDEELELFIPLFEAIRNFKPYEGKSMTGYDFTHTHNFPYGDGEYIPRADLGEKSVQDLYGEFKGLEKFLEYFCPFGNYGIHTIETILVYEVSNKTNFLKR